MPKSVLQTDSVLQTENAFCNISAEQLNICPVFEKKLTFHLEIVHTPPHPPSVLATMKNSGSIHRHPCPPTTSNISSTVATYHLTSPTKMNVSCVITYTITALAAKGDWLLAKRATEGSSE
jgi:hypothetical protein